MTELAQNRQKPCITLYAVSCYKFQGRNVGFMGPVEEAHANVDVVRSTFDPCTYIPPHPTYEGDAI